MRGKRLLTRVVYLVSAFYPSISRANAKAQTIPFDFFRAIKQFYTNTVGKVTELPSGCGG